MNRRVLGAVTAAALAAVALEALPSETGPGGSASGGGSRAPSVEAAFREESYRPGDRARLVVRDRSRRLTIQIFQSGPERVATRSDLEMNGVAVTTPTTIERVGGLREHAIAIGAWRSGVYFARLTAPDGRVGFAPFVVAPRRIGLQRVAVVLPTLTWQAYNFRDDDGDGLADTWYAGKRSNEVRLGRAHLDRGVPYGFRFHLGFLHWLHWTGRRADFLAQSDLERVDSGDTLDRAYDLVVFAGHHEYVTTREYDLVERYRDLGGNLVFLSANNFFWRVEREGSSIVKRGRWRDLGRPEAALVGVQFVAYRPAPRKPWVATTASARRWLFAGTGIRPGMPFSRGGVEIDRLGPASPERIEVVAEIPDFFGPGKTAQATYYETPSGARVFAAGAFHLTRAATSDPVVWRIVVNLWARMTHP